MRPYDEQARHYGAPRTETLSRTTTAVVVRVQHEDVAASRPRLLVDLIETDTRTSIANAVIAGQSGFDWCGGPPYPRVTTRNAATGVTFSTDYGTRLGQMAADDRPEGWDGDWCLVRFMGRQAVIEGFLTPSYRHADLANNQWTDPNAAKWLKPGTTLAGASQYDPATDELPVVNANSYPDQWMRRLGRMVASVWRGVGAGWELRNVNGANVLGDAIVHAEATANRVQLRAPRALVQFTDGKRALGVDTDAASETDLQLPLTPVVRHNQAKVVVGRLQDEIAELKQIVSSIATQHNALVADHKALQIACAAIQFAGGALTNATGAVPATSSTVDGSASKPAPTADELTAMRSVAVKAAP